MINFMSSLVNPYRYAKRKGIYVITEELGEQIAAYYHCTSGIKMVHINESILISRIFVSYFIYKVASDSPNTDKLSIIPVDSMFKRARSMPNMHTCTNLHS